MSGVLESINNQGQRNVFREDKCSSVRTMTIVFALVRYEMEPYLKIQSEGESPDLMSVGTWTVVARLGLGRS
jgi:hypothetical protein